MNDNHFTSKIKTLIDEAVHIVPYNSEWSMDFYKEKIRLEQALNDPSIAFEHIGSTSIPGMYSKPIIDIMIGIKDYPPSLEWINILCSSGYSYYGEAGVSERLYFTLRDKKNYNLAVVLLNGSHWEHNIRFRDFLREHPEDCREYEKVKSCAINSGANQLISYSDFKKNFLHQLFEKISKKSTKTDKGLWPS